MPYRARSLVHQPQDGRGRDRPMMDSPNSQRPWRDKVVHVKTRESVLVGLSLPLVDRNNCRRSVSVVPATSSNLSFFLNLELSKSVPTATPWSNVQLPHLWCNMACRCRVNVWLRCLGPSGTCIPSLRPRLFIDARSVCTAIPLDCSSSVSAIAREQEALVLR